MLEVLYYLDQTGDAPFAAWLASLDPLARAKITVVIERMQHGNLSDVKSVGGGVMERRIDWGPGYRIYFGRDGDTLIIVLAGGTKKRQQRDIENAQDRWTDYKRRKGH